MSERGSALLIALMSTMLLAALGAGVIVTSITETRIAANFRDAQETFYVAEAGLELSLHELMRLPEWEAVLAPASPGSVTDLDVSDEAAVRTAVLQLETDRVFGADPNRPRWVLHSARSPSSFLSDGAIGQVGVVAWTADDPWETDGDPRHDENGVVLLRVQAFGSGGRRRTLEMTLERVRPLGGPPKGIQSMAQAPPWLLDVVSWREVR